MCDRAVEIDRYSLGYVPCRFKTQDMCNKVVRKRPNILEYVIYHFKTQEMCYKALELDPWQLRQVPDHFKRKNVYQVHSVDPFELNHIILRCKKCTMRWWLNFFTPWVMFPITLRHRKCAMRRWLNFHTTWNMFLTGLWSKGKKKYGTMTIIFVIIIRSLNGTIVIKNARLKKTQ